MVEDGIGMETVMNGVEKRAAFYRGYLTDDRSFVPLLTDTSHRSEVAFQPGT